MTRKALNIYELSVMDAKDVFAYERSLGFIRPIYDAITHSDNVRAAKNAVHHSLVEDWAIINIFENEKQIRHYTMIASQRGYFCYRLPDNQFNHVIETRLACKHCGFTGKGHIHSKAA